MQRHDRKGIEPTGMRRDRRENPGGREGPGGIRVNAGKEEGTPGEGRRSLRESLKCRGACAKRLTAEQVLGTSTSTPLKPSSFRRTAS